MKLKIQILRDNGQSTLKWERASDKNIRGKMICKGNVLPAQSQRGICLCIGFSASWRWNQLSESTDKNQD